jgi:hypothetical protein
MADVIFNSFKKKLMTGKFILGTATIKVMLVSDAYSADQDADDFIDDASGSEISGTSYNAGGSQITTATVTQDDTDNEGVFDGDDTSWAASSISAAGAVLYRDTGLDTTSPVMCYFDFGATKTSENGAFTVQWDTEGIINLT